MTWSHTQIVWVSISCAILLCPLIHAYIAPKMTQHPEDILGVVGGRAVLSCRASGDPAPVYTWSKDGSEMALTGIRIKLNGGDLIFEKLEKDDVGVYQCTVRVSTPTFELKLTSRSAKVTISGMLLLILMSSHA